MTSIIDGHNQPGDDDSYAEAERLRLMSRSPHPYHLSASKDADLVSVFSRRELTGKSDVTRRNAKSKDIHSATASSESGTEADDETDRQAFVKALPPAQPKPRKGLKVGEKDEAALLTPSQLDQDGRPIAGRDYIAYKEVLTDSEERRILSRRRFNEFTRRCSEVGLMLLLSLLVLTGQGVLSMARQWWPEILCYVALIAALVLAYPIRLSLLDSRAAFKKPWQRFQVPVSFDPATILYPPLLPVLVALTLSPTMPALILPNIILGLSALPQRLFLRSSRLGVFNSMHWLVSILPLASGPSTNWLQCISSTTDFALSVETLASLYPLHHSLITSLNYLTTTSLLVSELHLLSIALINLLLFAGSPQAIILKACLWVGGLSLFVLVGRVLHWNVTLLRVPKWKFRREGHPNAERRSLIDAAADIMSLQRATKAFQGISNGHNSDADEDYDRNVSLSRDEDYDRNVSLSRNQQNGTALSKKSHAARSQHPRTRALYGDDHSVAASTNETSFHDGLLGQSGRVTLPVSSIKPGLGTWDDKRRARKPTAHVPWCLQLTVKQAQRRKIAYASWVYTVLVILILGPVRFYVGDKALYTEEPIGWALSYLFGQLPFFKSLVNTLALSSWIPEPAATQSFTHLINGDMLSLSVAETREAIGTSVVRLMIMAYWLVILTSGLVAVLTLTPYVEVDTRRKVFHGIMVGMFVPAVFVDPCFCALAMGLVLSIFLILEVIRAGQVPPLGTAIGQFVSPYVDGRDLRGPVVVSHLFLLVGCAVPLWFSLAGLARQDDGIVWRNWETRGQLRDTGMLSGVICVGMGDAAASLIGRRYGRRKWPWVGGKSLEGSAAFALAVAAGLALSKLWLHLGGWPDAAVSQHVANHPALWLLKALLCACGASFLEAVLTGANDNVVVPIALWLFVTSTRL